MEDLITEIRNLEEFMDKSNNPENDDAWCDFCQDIDDKIDNIKIEVEYYKKEMLSKDEEIEALNDTLGDIRNLVV